MTDLRDFHGAPSLGDEPILVRTDYEPQIRIESPSAPLGEFHTVEVEEGSNVGKMAGAFAVALMIGAAGVYAYEVSQSPSPAAPVQTASKPAPARAMAMAPAPASAAACRTSSSRRAASSTRAPSRTNVAAITGPRPVLAPVMIATLPWSKSCGISIPCRGLTGFGLFTLLFLLSRERYCGASRRSPHSDSSRADQAP